MECAVARGGARRRLENIQRLGIDEKSFGRGQSFMSILYLSMLARLHPERPCGSVFAPEE